MSTVRGSLAGLVVAAATVVAVPGTAHACSCVAAGPKQYVTWADAVVWAEVTDVQMPVTGNGTAHYLLDVDIVYKGEPAERVQVDSAASSAACGLEGIRAEESYVFFLRRPTGGNGAVDDGDLAEDVWTSGICDGTGGVGQQQVERVVGTVPPADEDRGRAPGREPAPGGPERLPLSGYAYAGMGVGVLGSALVAAVVWRRRRSAAA